MELKRALQARRPTTIALIVAALVAIAAWSQFSVMSPVRDWWGKLDAPISHVALNVTAPVPCSSPNLVARDLMGVTLTVPDCLSFTEPTIATYSSGKQSASIDITPKRVADYVLIAFVTPLTESERIPFVEQLESQDCSRRVIDSWAIWDCSLDGWNSVATGPTISMISESEMVTLKLLVSKHYPVRYQEQLLATLREIADRVATNNPPDPVAVSRQSI